MDTIFICQYCGKVCKNKLSKAKHEHMCKLNPDYEKHLEVQRRTTLKARTSPKNREKDRERALKRYEDFIKNNPDEAYKDFELTCKKCGCTFIRNLKIKHFKNNYRIPQFCCQEHANSHVHREEERERVSDSLKQVSKHICPKCGKEFFHAGKNKNTWCDECFEEVNGYSRQFVNDNPTVRKTGNIRRIGNDTSLHSSNCPNCNKLIWSKTSEIVYCYECCDTLHKRIRQLYDSCGKRVYSEKVKQKWRELAKQRVKNGTHSGWKSRNIKSYPEIFWEKVLDNNGISFEREIPTMRYFLDFVIHKGDKLIDLEIDGKQHKYQDRMHHDKIRDKKLRSNGYLVYRIDWNEINSKHGSLRMKYKINQFLWWYNHQ